MDAWSATVDCEAGTDRMKAAAISLAMGCAAEETRCIERLVSVPWNSEKQVPPLRFASAGMTELDGARLLEKSVLRC